MTEGIGLRFIDIFHPATAILDGVARPKERLRRSISKGTY
jgi:hypothetical protein